MRIGMGPPPSSRLCTAEEAPPALILSSGKGWRFDIRDSADALFWGSFSFSARKYVTAFPPKSTKAYDCMWSSFRLNVICIRSLARGAN
jgi:hypothetical protein